MFISTLEVNHILRRTTALTMVVHQVGDWSCRLGEGLAACLMRFYQSNCPEKVGNVEYVAAEFHNKQEKLKSLLQLTYGKDLSSVPPVPKRRVRRIAYLTFVVESGSEDFAVTFPGPVEKRVAFLAELEDAFCRRDTQRPLFFFSIMCFAPLPLILYPFLHL